jgi:hypothetical protein
MYGAFHTRLILDLSINVKSSELNVNGQKNWISTLDQSKARCLCYVYFVINLFRSISVWKCPIYKIENSECLNETG